jgi:hypothetical protein
MSHGAFIIEERHLTIEAKKPWLKLEMSRRTWYRRHDGAPVLLGLLELSSIGSFTIDQAHNQIRFN